MATTCTITVNPAPPPLTLSVTLASLNFGALSLCPASLAVGKSCTIYLSLFVDDRGPSLSAKLNIPNNATGGPQSVALSATVR